MNDLPPRMFYAHKDVLLASILRSVARQKIGEDVFDVVQLISVEVDDAGSPSAKSVESIFIHADCADKDFSYSTILGNDGITHCAPKRFPTTFEFDHVEFFRFIGGSTKIDELMSYINNFYKKDLNALPAIQLLQADSFLSKTMLKRAKKLGMFFMLMPVNVLHIPLVKFGSLPSCVTNEYSTIQQPLQLNQDVKVDKTSQTFFLVEAVVEDYVNNENSFDAMLEKRITAVFEEYRSADSTECPEFVLHTFHVELAQFHNRTVEIDTSEICGVFGSLHDPKSDQTDALEPNSIWISRFDIHPIKPATVLKFLFIITFKGENDPGFKDMFMSKVLKTVKNSSVACDDVISLKTSF